MNKKRILLYLLLAVICNFVIICLVRRPFSVTGLLTEYQESPLGIEAGSPHFSWQMESALEGASQTAYEIQLWEGVPCSGKPLWESGKVDSDKSVGIEYAGPALSPETRYFWRVTVWNQKGRKERSKPQWFETGLGEDGWDGARWIGSSQANFSKYRSLYDISFSLRLDEGSDHGTFVLGARDEKTYILTDYDRSGKFTVSHFKDGVQSIDAVIDIPQEEEAGMVHRFKLDVMATDYAKAYDIIPVIDGLEYDKVRVRFDADADWQPFCRLYSIGYSQPEGQTAVLSDIVIRTKVWDRELYHSGESVCENGAAFWSPAEESGAPMLRRSFSTEGRKIASARLYTTARGIYEYFINGKRLSADYFNPGSTDYRYRIMYNSYDITSYLKKGENAVCAQLGAGWWTDFTGFRTDWQDQFGVDLSLLAKIVINYSDGTKDIILSDGSWKVYDKGPVTSDSFLNGEDYDARREVPGWTEADFDDSSWTQASIYEAPSAEVKISPYVGAPVQLNEILTAVSVTEPEEGVFVYDMGQNMVGIPCIKATGKAGDELTLNFGEMTYPTVIPEDPVPPLTIEDYQRLQGQVYNQNYRGALATDHYIFKGDPKGETICPHFTFHGFRYIAIHGLKAALPLENVKACVLHSIGEQKSDYHTDNADINRLFSNIVWGQKGNFLSIPTDCPQRDERMGWTGDAQIFARSATYNMNVNPFYTRWFYSVRDTQGENGSYCDYIPKIGVPPVGSRNGGGALGWMETGIIIPWQMYLQYGDRHFLEVNYESMKRYMEYLVERSDNLIQPAGGYGDWLAVEPTDTRLTNTAYSAYDARLMAKMAGILGKQDDSEYFTKLFNDIKEAFFNAGFEFNTQTSLVVPLQAGLFEGKEKEAAVNKLVEDIEGHGYRLTTGFIGTPYLNLVLSENGRSDIAFKLFEQTEYPSWLYPVLQGATTIWERWNSYTIKNGFGLVDMNSFNHYSYGAIEEWMMSHSLGIQVDENEPAYKRIILQPSYSPSLGTVKGGFETPYGPVKCVLKPEKDGFSYEVTIPANTSAVFRGETYPAGHHKFHIKQQEE